MGCVTVARLAGPSRLGAGGVGGGLAGRPPPMRVTKASPEKIEGSPWNRRSAPAAVVGKSAESVLPATYTLPLASSATSEQVSVFAPPRKVA
jgi:hypothetical protein